MLKAEANNESLSIDPPDRREMLDPYTAESDSKFNKMMINISDDHYTNNYSSVTSSVENNTNKCNSVGSRYNNDDRFASVSSEPWNKDEVVEASSDSSTSSTIFSYLGAAFYKTKELAVAVKDKVSEIELGSKLAYTGGLTVEALKYTDSKVYEKGQDLMVKLFFNILIFIKQQSESLHNIKEKATGGIQYIVGSILNRGSGNSSSSDRYSSCSSSSSNSYNSSSYSQDNHEDESNSSYVKMNDNKKENLLDNDYKYYWNLEQIFYPLLNWAIN